MRRFVLSVSLFLFACAATAQQPGQKRKTDLELIQGTWRIVGLESAGKQQSDKAFNGNRFEFSRTRGVNTVSLKEGPYPAVDFTFTLNPSQTPKAIDLTTRGNTAHGIYKLEGDDLTICVSLGGPRPSEFATRPGSDTEIFTLKRSRWERYFDKTIGYSISFPGKPTETNRDFDTPTGKVTATVLTVRSEIDHVSYSATVVPLTAKLKAMESEEVLDAACKTVLAEIDKDANPKVESDRPVLKAPQGVSAGREFTISIQSRQSGEPSVMRVRVYISGERLYVLAVSGTGEMTRSQNVAPFWESFRAPTEKRRDFPSK